MFPLLVKKEQDKFMKRMLEKVPRGEGFSDVFVALNKLLEVFDDQK